MSLFIITCLAFSQTLSLEDALRTLEQKNPTLVQAKSRAQEASGIARQALSGALPQLSATGSYTRNSQEARAPLGQIAAAFLPPGAPVPADLIIQPLEVWSGVATARLPLIMPSVWTDFAAALSTVDAAKASAETVRLQLRNALTQAAWMAQAAEEIEAATERALTTANEHLQSAKHAAAVGTSTNLAVLQAETEWVKRKSDLAQARAERARIELTIGVLLGEASPVRITVTQTSAASEPVADLRTRALLERPELSTTRAQATAARRQLASAWLRHVPTLGVTGSAFKQTVALPTGRDDGWRVTVDLTWSIYDGGLRYGKQQQADAALQGAEAAARQVSLQIEQEVEDGARQVALANERFQLATEQQRLASAAAATAQRGFAAGIASSLEVRDANDRLYAAEVSLANARARVGSAAAQLKLAVGGR